MTTKTSQQPAFAPSLGLAEQIADHIQKQIVSEILKPGDRIPEAQITAELNVSRGPVRESLRVLSRRHLVDLLPRKGARVSDFGPRDVNALYDLQEALLLLLVRRVSERWQPDDLARFRQLQDALNNAADDAQPLEVLELSFEFQRAACELLDNTYMTSTFTDLQPSFSRAYYRALAAGEQEVQGLERFIDQLINEIVSGNVEECERLVREMCEHQRQVVLQTFDN